jgi:hypothetical protein
MRYNTPSMTTALLALSAAAAWAGGPSCEEALSARDLIKDLRRPELEGYADCANLAAGGEDQCALFDLLGPPRGPVKKSHNAFGKGLSPDVEGCRRIAYWTRLADAAVSKSPRAEAYCRDYWTTLLPDDLDKVPLACELMLGSAPIEATCRRLVASLPSVRGEAPKVLRLCAYDLRVFRGQAQDCSKAKDYSFDNSGKSTIPCRAFQGAARARAGNDPELCGEDGFCRFLVTRDARACDVYLRDARRARCAARP